MNPQEVTKLLFEKNRTAIEKILEPLDSKEVDIIKYTILNMIQRNLKLVSFCNKYFNYIDFYNLDSKNVLLMFNELFKTYGLYHAGHIYWKRKNKKSENDNKYSDFNEKEIVDLMRIEEHLENKQIKIEIAPLKKNRQECKTCELYKCKAISLEYNLDEIENQFVDLIYNTKLKTKSTSKDYYIPLILCQPDKKIKNLNSVLDSCHSFSKTYIKTDINSTFYNTKVIPDGYIPEKFRNPDTSSPSSTEKELVLFDIRRINNKSIYIYLTSTGDKVKIDKTENVPVYIKRGKYGDCRYFENIDDLELISINEYEKYKLKTSLT